MSTSEAITRDIRIRVTSRYVPERSAPERQLWLFAYTIRITNQGAVPVQLLTRHWIITSASGHVDEVQGEGVVGEQPVLASGQTFEYVSACPLGTPYGTMKGTYGMRTMGGENFDVDIASFALSQPYAVN